RMQALDFPLTF
nr:immunoglobulin light chain junction region [Macaca mulatta]